MRVLFLTERYPPLYTGGYEIACHAIAEGLRERGHAVRILTSNYRLGEGRPTGEAHVSRILHRPQDSPSLLEIARWEIADNAAVLDAIRRHRPDVVYTWSLLQLFASLHRTLASSGVPVAYLIQDLFIPKQLREDAQRLELWTKAGRAGLNALVKPLLRSLLRLRDRRWSAPVRLAQMRLDRVAFVSEFQREQHLAAGLPAGDARIIRNGVRLELFDSPPRGRDGTLRVLFVGRLVPEKGAHVALDAVVNLRRRGVAAMLSIAGISGHPIDYCRSLEERARAAGAGVELLGPVPQSELPRVYGRHDVLAFPSRHREGLPMVVLEAMASRLPIVATPTGGTGQLLADAEVGLQIGEEDPEALAAALERLARDAELASRLGSNGRSWVETHCALELILDQTEAFLAAAAGRA
jgi:glycosyltransferase involved in cell wall biosynthesis